MITIPKPLLEYFNKVLHLIRLIALKTGYFLLFFLGLPLKLVKQVTLVKPIKLLKPQKPIITFKGKEFIFGILFSIIFIFMPLKIYEWIKLLPNPDSIISQSNNKTTTILDRKGRLLYEIFQDKKYAPVSLSQIPDTVIKSTLAIEDSEFYNHNGIRPLSMLKSLQENTDGETLRGGSTITQQLVKNVLLTPERTIDRKLKEIVLSLAVETKYTKDEILELYLNNISYGGTSYGIQSAAQKYFGKNVSELNLSEASLLAGMITAPSMYSPKENDITAAKERQRLVLDRMVYVKYISQDEADVAYNTDLKIQPSVDYIRAPHFVAYIRSLLEKEYGERYLEIGGLTITTSLDLDIQDEVQQIVKEEVAKSGALNISNGASVVLDTRTGEILAYVGSKDYFADTYGSFDVVTALRQPGSSIKPVTYALALTKGFTAASIIDDSPVTFRNPFETYTPVNYDGRFHGNVTLRAALANSYNIPAVKLASKLGPDNIVTLGHDMGLINWRTDGSYGISVTLGGKEVRLLDLTNVYATLGRDGTFKDVQPILNIKDKNGYDIFINKGVEKQVLTPQTSYLITNILSDNNARLPAFGVNNFLSIKGHTIAVKTGTTDLKRDNYTFGYTPSYTVGVWVGNNDNKPMNPYLASGLSGAAPIWNKIMLKVLGNSQNEAFVMPEGVLAKRYTDCGGRLEYFDTATKIPDTVCALAKTDEKVKKDKKS